MVYDWKVMLRKAALAGALVMLAAIGAQLGLKQSLKPLADLGFWDKQAAAGIAAAIGALLAALSNFASFKKAQAQNGK